MHPVTNLPAEGASSGGQGSQPDSAHPALGRKVCLFKFPAIVNVTNITLVWLFLAMGEKMNLQMPSSSEYLVAHFTFVWPVPTMSENVLVEASSCSERIATDLTLM